MSRSCVICGLAEPVEFFARTGVPLFQNLPLSSAEEARNAPRGDLQLACCPECGFVGNLAFSEELLRYGKGYENDQTYSALFDAHVDALVDRVISSGTCNKSVVEVGCGRGQFLRRVCARGNNIGFGYDPAYVGPDTADDGRVSFVREYYGPEFRDRPADAVICRHVIEHVPEPMSLLAAVKDALRDTREATLFFETPALEWILERVALEDVFFEHCSYFTAESLRFAFERAGFRDVAVEYVFGGQYLWLVAKHEATVRATSVAARQHDTLAKTLEFGRREAARAEEIRSRLISLRREGPLAIWGAGAKGVTFLDRIDRDVTLVDCAVDINPRKQGRFIPGTGHPIVNPNELALRHIANVVVMNPNYVEEVEATLRRQGASIGVHSETVS